MSDFVTFIGHQRGWHEDAPHIVRALVSAKERQFLHDWSITFDAVSDLPRKDHPGERVITATRDTWRVISEELEAYAKAGDKSPDDMSNSQHHARAWSEAIRVRVLGKDVRYFGLG